MLNAIERKSARKIFNLINYFIFMDNLKIGIYKHFKGGKIKVLHIANHSETLEKFVVYEVLYECRTYGKTLELTSFA